ncbi:hypothetical protein ACGFRB_13990 [Streptomyces sp. NPDC048718]|uniref:golvesin C-terminal-like domain-containing protein n=1 Tax=Streptomyces sp. NPDC048718 TaxID=3365587 RepID=UPI00371309A6
MTAAAVGALFAGTLQATATAAETPAPLPALKMPGKAKPHDVPADERSRVLGKDWKKSTDLAWTAEGDARGFHLFTAREGDGYAWTTTASLSEPGFDTDAWIGNACVTGSGKRAVVVYAPRTFTNDPRLMARGAFAAVVELETGEVTKLPVQVSLSYYNPGCGTGEQAVLTQSGGEDKAATRLLTLDTVTGKLSEPIQVGGQVTSSVPAKDGSVIGAAGAQIVKIDRRGAKTVLAVTESTPYRLVPDADGGLVFLDRPAAASSRGKASSAGRNTTRAKHITADQVNRPAGKKSRATVLAEGPQAHTGLTGNAGTVYLTGQVQLPQGVKLPRAVRHLSGTPKDAKVTTAARAVLTKTAWSDGQGALLRYDGGDKNRPVDVTMHVLESDQKAEFTVDPQARRSPRIAEGSEPTPALKSADRQTSAAPLVSSAPSAVRALAAASGARDEAVESERTCSVPRNDPHNQAMQPKPRQVEWAVNMAIRDALNNHISRPANWKNLGMPAYQPQTLFPAPTLEGGGTIPAQVMLGVTAQESNMWQASRVAVPGVTANPLIGNYYGIDLYDGDSSNDWDVDWAEADCGYGITQVTDHMRLAGREDGHGGAAWDYQKQRAVALDYTANVAAGLQILADKWNTTRRAGLVANNGNPAKLENWTFALWSYNSGFHENTGMGQPWGVGWSNNPANPEWDAGRSPFMEDGLGNEDAADASHPQDWPYQEKVLGFAAHPPSYLESPGTMVPAFRAASWNGKEGDATVAGSAKQNRAQVKPPEDLFCTAANSCDPARISDSASNSAFTGPCTLADFKCWWNEPVQWKSDCDSYCGNDFTRFPVTWAEEPDGTAYPPNCTTAGLPTGARIVDDLPEGTPVVRPGCDNSGWTNKGSFTFDFGDGESGCTGCSTKWPAKADLHQLGAGFGGHFYFGHTRKDDAKGNRLKITGTWKLNESLDQAKVFVHLPDHGAQTKVAQYEIKTRDGIRTRTVSQPGNGNRWVDIGYYRFAGTPEVSLSTITSDGTGDQDVAFDAVAFVPGRFGGVDITLPEPDKDAPNVDWDTVNGPISMAAPVSTPVIPDAAGATGLSSTGLNALRASGAVTSAESKGMSCSRPDSSGKVGCVRSVSDSKEMGSLPAPKQRIASPLAATAGTSWCTNHRGSHRYTRFEACFHNVYEYQAWKISDNEPPDLIGEANFDMYHYIGLERRLGTFRQSLEVWPISIDQKLVNITLDIRFNCFESDSCESQPEHWDASLTWTPGDVHIARATKEHAWKNQASTRGWDPIGFNWKYQAYTPVAGPAAVRVNADDLLAQCDNFATAGTVGCSFGTYAPTYVFNSKKYPAAAAHAWLIQNALASTHAGSKKFGSPMNYLPNNKNKYGRNTDDNRRVICPKSYQYHSKTTLLHELVESGGADVASCDEFAFAGSYQSAGMPAEFNGRNPVDSGDACVQTYATRVAQGTWKLYDDDRYPLPTFNEVCGRSSMAQWQNGGSMNRFGGFASYFRLLDSDEYWVDIPGFENCSPAGPLVECTMTP